MHQHGGTIGEALESIASRGYVLPAIQREFVWRPEQVCNLFDSVMQGYPFGEFMFWRVEAQNADQYRCTTLFENTTKGITRIALNLVPFTTNH